MVEGGIGDRIGVVLNLGFWAKSRYVYVYGTKECGVGG